ncbi:hypothetical protein M0R45_011172 [Rubus argutus]|uniref:UspA domain-containing protein n=1 Tax=Rubus argutus TaxID=59490 RepID=A0AAW1Y9Z1_RUBAR
MAEKQVMIVAADESEHSTYALQWTLDHFFIPSAPTRLSSSSSSTPSPCLPSVVGLAGPGAAEVLPIVDADLKRQAGRVIEKAKEFCASKSIKDVVVEVHGYGAIKRAVLGSVSDYCAHHAHCSVMIVKRPKTKH